HLPERKRRAPRLARGRQWPRYRGNEQQPVPFCPAHLQRIDAQSVERWRPTNTSAIGFETIKRRRTGSWREMGNLAHEDGKIPPPRPARIFQDSSAAVNPPPFSATACPVSAEADENRP